MHRHNKKRFGYTIIEALLTLAILAVVVVAAMTVFSNAMHAMTNAKNRIVAVSLGNELMERLRNMAYDNIGVSGGMPSGAIPADQEITRSNTTFSVHTRIDYQDDPLDGLVIGTNPLDTTPADYKRVELIIDWNDNAVPVTLTGRYAPNGLEVATNTGALLITVFDSSGQPVPLADVHVTNPNVTPAVDITNTTDVNGNLQLLSLAPDVEGYHIEVSKAGYSTAQTYPITAGNPTPVPIDVTVAVQTPTQIGFGIDLVSTLQASIYNESCVAIPNFEFTLYGEKIIGLPNVLKYTQAHQVGADGKLTISDLEWDNYDISLDTPGYTIAGFSPPNALQILAGTNINWTLVLAPATAHSLHLKVFDSSNQVPITDASVTLTGTNGSTKVTGRGYLQQTDWSGGSGQETLTDLTKYQSDDGNVDVSSTSGQIELASSSNIHAATEAFDDTANKDETTTTADWNTSLSMLQLVETGGVYISPGEGQSMQLNEQDELITSATLTVADNANGQTIAYYLSADGVTFEAVTPGVEHTFVSPGSDLRFKVELSTADTGVTPTVSDLSITYTSKRYAANGTLTSSTFDTGSESTYSAINWNPTSQIAIVGEESIRFQIATNNDNTTWNYIGPDGTAATYYTISNSQISSAHDNTRYLRYRVYLQTAHVGYSPTLSDLSMGHTTECTLPGQVFYSDLAEEAYTIDVTHPDYQPYNGSINVSGATSGSIELIPL